MKSRTVDNVPEKIRSSKAFLSFLFTIFKEHYDIGIQNDMRIRGCQSAVGQSAVVTIA